MKKTTLFNLLVAVAAIGLFVGCSSIQKNPGSVASAVKVASYVGTHEALLANPEWRAGFEEAQAALFVIEQQEVIDFAVLLAIVHRLPIKELESDRAVLIITAATILLTEYGNPAVPLDTGQDLRLVARALREGIQLGLGGS